MRLKKIVSLTTRANIIHLNNGEFAGQGRPYRHCKKCNQYVRLVSAGWNMKLRKNGNFVDQMMAPPDMYMQMTCYNCMKKHFVMHQLKCATDNKYLPSFYQYKDTKHLQGGTELTNGKAGLVKLHQV
jgi:hypothetical protein